MPNRFLMRCRSIAAVVPLIAIASCSSPPTPSTTAAAAGSARETQTPLIDHLEPRRDSTGRMPRRFRWTPVEGAAHYELAIWNDIDVLMWRDRNLREASVTLPSDVVLEPGTYFWEVVAIRDDRLIAESGRSAFVVRDNLP